MNTLIVIDMQYDFIYGDLGSREAKSIVPKVIKRIAQYRERGYEVIFTRDTHTSDYLNTHEGKSLPVKHCIKGTYGWTIPEEIDIPECEHIDKPYFGWTMWDLKRKENGGFEDRKLDKVEIVGLCTDVCVISNAMILRSVFPEIDIAVNHSCCAGTSKENHKNALNAMKSCQIIIL